MPSPLAPLARAARRRILRAMPRLPASEDDHGTTDGDGPPLRLAVLGDSAAAGVGARSHQEALAGALAEALTHHTRRAVSWRAIAESGATAGRVTNVLIRDLTVPAEGWRPDVIVVVAGLNDLLRGRSAAQWARDAERLLAEVWHRAPQAVVVVSGLPPLDRFPRLPALLRPLARWRLRRMDRILGDAAARRGLPHVPLREAGVGPDLFAADGFHPSPFGYRLWAGVLAPVILDRLPTTSVQPTG